VRQFTPPKMKMQLDFEKQGYGLSDEVKATFTVGEVKEESLRMQQFRK